MNNTRQALLAMALLMSAGLAPAQEPPPPDAATLAIPKPTCDKPPANPGADSSELALQRFNRRYTEYKQCMLDYATSMQKRQEAYVAIAQKYLDSGNAAIKEFNDYAEALKEWTEKHDNK